MYAVDARQFSEQNDHGYAASGVWADDGLGLTYAEDFTYEHDCGRGNGAAVVLFVGVVGAIVHVNDANGVEAEPHIFI